MATVVHAAGSARLFGLSHSLAYAQGGDVFYSCGGFNTPTLASGVLIAALGSSAGSCKSARQLKCSEQIASMFARFAGRHGCAVSKIPIDNIKSAWSMTK